MSSRDTLFAWQSKPFSDALFLSLCLATGLTGSWAAVPASRPYASPEIHPDHRVTFRILAPKASEVTLEGGWMAVKETVPLVKDDQGLWSVTVGPLKPTVYGYWFNLDGAVVLDQANQFIRERTGATSVSAVDIPDATPLPWSVRDVPHGKVETHWIKSQTYAGETRNAWVYLPPGYEKDGAKKYPVLYLFHGGGELYRSWVESGKANLIFDNMLADGKMKPMIVVMPFTGAATNAALALAPTQAPSPSGPPRLPTQAMDYVLKEIMPWSESHFRILPGRKNRALAGFSAGGALAAAISFKHLDVASEVGIFSSPIPSFKTNYPEAAARPATVNAKLDLLLIGVGKSDPQVIDWLRNVDDELTQLGVHHTYLETDGAHDYAVWRWCLVQFAPLLFRN
jgi:enterochelin esterase family protein